MKSQCCVKLNGTWKWMSAAEVNAAPKKNGSDCRVYLLVNWLVRAKLGKFLANANNNQLYSIQILLLSMEMHEDLCRMASDWDIFPSVSVQCPQILSNRKLKNWGNSVVMGAMTSALMCIISQIWTSLIQFRCNAFSIATCESTVAATTKHNITKSWNQIECGQNKERPKIKKDAEEEEEEVEEDEEEELGDPITHKQKK